MFFKLRVHDNETPTCAIKNTQVFKAYSGLGLWEAVFHDHDPAHPKSQWIWSEDFRKLLGFAADDVVNMPNTMDSWVDRLHPEDKDVTLDKMLNGAKSGSRQFNYDVEYRLKTQDGSYQWFRATGSTTRSQATGQAERSCGIISNIDVHKNKLIVADLRDRCVGVGLWDCQLVDGDGDHEDAIWNWSEEFRGLMGFAPEDPYTETLSYWADRLHPDDVEQAAQGFEAAQNDLSGQTVYDVEYRLKLKDGTYRWFRAVGGFDRDETGAADRVAGSLIDIHKQKLAELAQIEAEKDKKANIENLAISLDTQVLSAAESAKDNIQSVASASVELNSSIEEISRQVHQAYEASSTAYEVGFSAKEQIASLSKAVEEIGSILTMISDIASKTNLLALNATIEAARAGDAGKGFAVVANEVKALASQTGEATDQISTQIASVDKEVRSTVSAVHSILEQVSGIQSTSQAITNGVEQQNLATKEISERVNQVAGEVSSISDNVLNVSQSLREKNAS